ncbi:MAG: PKD domain protein [Euryarchaeota archaeon ADurb.BinA087]|nr:MAG: PKD domain protein [Euryarchaeota archaeon ADurb.BinA087]
MGDTGLKKTHFLILLFAFFCILGTTASASNLIIGNGRIDAIGGTAAFDIILDSAPNGLAGYSINVAIGNPSVATIAAATFPGWVTNNDIIPPLPASSCKLKGLDGEELIQDGAGNIVLATVTLQGLEEGVTPVTLNVVLMSDDDDLDINPTVVPGTLIVELPPLADFSANTTSGYPPLTVQFTDLSAEEPTEWSWDFTSDGSIDSDEQNPSFTYESPGTYSVTLTATNDGGSDTEIKANYITVIVPPPVANFTANTTSGTMPLKVQFTDLSTGSPTSWSWDFQNDGSTDSTVQNPVFTYPAAGTYTVNLTATNAGGSDEEIKNNYITVNIPPPVANFTANTTSGTMPLTVQFTDLSTGSPTSWSWDFQNDGSTDSTVQNPVFTYPAAGTYTVNLTATNAGGSDEEIKNNYITVNIPPPVANFTANTTSGYAPLTVQFTDLSTGSPTSWTWDFQNDGSADSTVQNPMFTYPAAGTYTVNLTATNAGGSDEEIKNNYITVNIPPPVANFTANTTSGYAPLTVQFTDLSTGSPTSWAWDFQNDGSTDSTVQNPMFTYPTAGTYSVKLTANNDGGADTETKSTYITVTVAPPVANFTANTTSGYAPLTVQFTDLSTGSPTSWTWDFQNDGSTDSTVQNPLFTYPTAGTYSVKLTATNDGGADTETKSTYITVTVAPPVANFTANTTSGYAPLTVQFTDLSTGSPTSWAWDFNNDGTVEKTDQNPVITFPAGTYTVKLTATNTGGSDAEIKSNYITVTIAPPVADFTANKTSGTAPLTVQFTDLSTGSPTSWAWDFNNDGTVDKTDQNPKITFPAGTYTVKLTATNVGGSDAEIKTNYITVTIPPPVANFTANKTSGTLPLTVQFTDLSTGTPTSWAWDFQNDGSTDSTAQNPMFTYPAAGTYTVNLTATNTGGSDAEVKTNFITVNIPPPVANFTGNTTSGYAPLTVQFTDLSTGSPTSWAWDFNNDGTVDKTDQNPVITFPAGTYTVKLTATNTGGSDVEIKTNYITVTVAPPVADFTANKTSGTAPLTVQFTDLSTGSPTSWAWDFNNDGTVDKTEQNPKITFPAGTYTVKLTVINAGGSDSEIKTNYITVTIPPPVANFTANKTSGTAPLTVQFTDLSTGSPTSWAWDFQNDGSTDNTVQNPVFTYLEAGTYTVNLTATNAGGSDAEIKTNYISVTVAPPVANFTANITSGYAPLTVQFTDLSTGSPMSWAWDFQNDGSTDSTDQNPVFTYPAAGTFTVKLTATNDGGSDPEIKTNYITVTVAVPPEAKFSADKQTGIAPLEVQFMDESTGSGPLTYAWDFNSDGTVESELQNPQITFPSGIYTVTLTVTGPGGSDSETMTDYIRSYAIIPLPGQVKLPADPDGDGLFEDIDGSGTIGYDDDFIPFFENIEWMRSNEPVPAFDFSGNGVLGFHDAVLFLKEVR